MHQDVDAEPARAQPRVHGCTAWPTVARAPYIWWLPPEQRDFTCPYCHQQVHGDEGATAAPIDHPAHPWWKVPQARTRFYYSRFWENWPATKGRSFL